MYSVRTMMCTQPFTRLELRLTSTKAPRQRTPVTKVQASNSSACKCGISKVDDVFQLEISGGDVALPHQFPWMVRLINGCRLSKFFIELTKSNTAIRRDFAIKFETAV